MSNNSGHSYTEGAEVPEDKTPSDNELIAIFIGYRRIGPPGIGRFDVGFGYPSHTLSALKFDTSWDWLMPVVEKIANHCDAIVEMSICLAAHCRIFAINKQRSPIKEFINGGSISLLESTYLTVVEFIKWYNIESLKNKPI